MYQDGGATKGEIDRMATSTRLESVDDHAVEEWIAGKLDVLLGEAGIYLARTPTPPPAIAVLELHYAYTLENIVKAMKEGQEERGGSTWGASAKTLAIRGDAGIPQHQEIKADSGRLGMDEGTEYEAKLQAIDDQIGRSSRRSSKGNKAHSDNSFVESDIIEDPDGNVQGQEDGGRYHAGLLQGGVQNQQPRRPRTSRPSTGRRRKCPPATLRPSPSAPLGLTKFWQR